MLVKLQYPSPISKSQILQAIKDTINDTLDPLLVAEQINDVAHSWEVVGDNTDSLTLRSPISDRDGYHYARFFVVSDILFFSYGDAYNEVNDSLSFKGVVETPGIRVSASAASSTYGSRLILSLTSSLIVYVPNLNTTNARVFGGVLECESNSGIYGPEALLPVVLAGTGDNKMVQHPDTYKANNFVKCALALPVNHGALGVKYMMMPDGSYSIFEAGFSVTTSSLALKTPLQLMRYLALPDNEDISFLGQDYVCVQTAHNSTTAFLITKG